MSNYLEHEKPVGSKSNHKYVLILFLLIAVNQICTASFFNTNILWFKRSKTVVFTEKYWRNTFELSLNLHREIENSIRFVHALK